MDERKEGGDGKTEGETVNHVLTDDDREENTQHTYNGLDDCEIVMDEGERNEGKEEKTEERETINHVAVDANLKDPSNVALATGHHITVRNMCGSWEGGVSRENNDSYVYLHVHKDFIWTF